MAPYVHEFWALKMAPTGNPLRSTWTVLMSFDLRMDANCSGFGFSIFAFAALSSRYFCFSATVHLRTPLGPASAASSSCLRRSHSGHGTMLPGVQFRMSILIMASSWIHDPSHLALKIRFMLE